MKPFIKWVGGKTNLLPTIVSKLPKYIDNYVEVFLGGGAVFYELRSKDLIHGSITLNDYNQRLITTYEVVRDSPNELLELLRVHKENHSKDYYYKQRAKFNITKDPLELASLFIYLNKTGFNGLYRVNSKNEFNVPIGSYKNPKIYDPEVILNSNKVLNGVDLTNNDFREIYIRSDTFYYMDPPYYNTFTQYTDVRFNEEFQRDLFQLCRKIDKEGSQFMLSNSLDPFIMDLYKNFNIHIVKASRQVSCKTKSRGKIDEVLITNC